jgi:hypothetical protein
MLKLPFGRRARDAEPQAPSEFFAAYCEAERERLRDAGEALDERRFQAAVDLALARLRAIEDEERA